MRPGLWSVLQGLGDLSRVVSPKGQQRAPVRVGACRVTAGQFWGALWLVWLVRAVTSLLSTSVWVTCARMAEQEPTAEQLAQIAAENEEDEHSVNYKPPAQKSIQEIQELDKDDESLRKYKEALLGAVTVTADPNAPNVVVTKLTLVCATAPGPLELDLTGDLDSYKKQAFVLKEGVEYRIKISFRVNREIVSGLKYIQHTFRKGVKIDKTEYMVGSYGPRAEEYEFLTPMEEAPKGMLARGSYNIKSKFTDDDKTDHLSWEWNLTIKKDWKD
uniref:Rho GDP-dissociation inhibitor 1 n=1 Tax=Taeniopygia guttata TaxID=59729 RepID=H0YZ76_TAEGU